MTDLHTRLTAALSLADPGLVGCARRNHWADEADREWRFLRGNALLAAIGERITAYTPEGFLEAYAFENNLLQFRGGPWQNYWNEDFFDLWALFRAYGPYLSRIIYVLHENQGDLTVREITVPDFVDPTERAASLVAAYKADPPGRISKAGDRAFRVCRHCPVRTRCEALDELHDQTTDWSPAYRSLP